MLPARQARWTRPWPWAGAGKVPSRKHTLPSSAPPPANFEPQASSFKLQTPNPCFLCNHRNLTAPAPGCFEFRAAGFGATIDRIAIPSPTKWAIRETDYSDAIIIVIAIATSAGKGINKGRAGPYRPRHLPRGCSRGIGGSIHGRHRARCLPRGLQRDGCRHRSENTGREHVSVRGCSHCRGATWLRSASTYFPFGCSLTLMLTSVFLHLGPRLHQW